LRHNPVDGSSLAFTFDSVHDEGTTQAQIFDEVSDVVQSVLHGHNGCIICYGQTGLVDFELIKKHSYSEQG
jgi:hypothetical protein